MNVPKVRPSVMLVIWMAVRVLPSQAAPIPVRPDSVDLDAPRAVTAVLPNEIGPPLSFSRPEVELSLNTSSTAIAAGDLWSCIGEFRNRSSKPVWITDKRSDLFLPPEMWGLSSEGGAVGAFFPSVPVREGEEVMRLEPGATYDVIWKLDPTRDRREGSNGKTSLWYRVNQTIKDYLFFRPGPYTVTAVAHVWPVAPSIGPDGEVDNPGSSFTIAKSLQVSVGCSQWVFAIGAVIGGLIAFVLRMLVALKTSTFVKLGGIKYLFSGATIAVLLCSIGTVLISRLATTDFLVSVKVQDIWGATATGFVIQWLGLGYLDSRVRAAAAVPATERLTAAEHVEKTAEAPPDVELERGAEAPIESPKG